MNNKILTLLLILSFCKGTGQNLDREEQAFNCIEKVYQEQGFEITTIMKDFEALLISKKYLVDSSGKSYYNLLKQIIDQKEMQIDTSASFVEYDHLLKISKEVNKKSSICSLTLLTPENGDKTKWQLVQEDIMRKFQVEPPRDTAWLCKLLLKNLNYQDFNNHFYKLKAMLAIDLVNEKWGRRQMLPPIGNK